MKVYYISGFFDKMDKFTTDTFDMCKKMDIDIDMKITNLQIRLVEATSNIHKRISDGINEWQKEEESGKRVFLQDMFFEVSEKAYKKLYNIYKEDMKF